MFRDSCSLLLAIWLMALAGCAAVKPGPSRDVADIVVHDVNGRPHHPLSFQASGQRAAALVFITVDCPIANGYAPEIKRIIQTYQSRGVAFSLVHVDPAVTAAQAREHAQAYGYDVPVLLDSTHALVKATGVSVTPEAAVYDHRGQLVYRGRIDDRHQDFGKRKFEPSVRDLRDALDALLEGRSIAASRTRAIGCPIPFEVGS